MGQALREGGRAGGGTRLRTVGRSASTPPARCPATPGNPASTASRTPSSAEPRGEPHRTARISRRPSRPPLPQPAGEPEPRSPPLPARPARPAGSPAGVSRVCTAAPNASPLCARRDAPRAPAPRRALSDASRHRRARRVDSVRVCVCVSECVRACLLVPQWIALQPGLPASASVQCVLVECEEADMAGGRQGVLAPASRRQ